jgi:hypothetical protein
MSKLSRRRWIRRNLIGKCSSAPLAGGLRLLAWLLVATFGRSPAQSFRGTYPRFRAVQRTNMPLHSRLGGQPPARNGRRAQLSCWSCRSVLEEAVTDSQAGLSAVSLSVNGALQRDRAKATPVGPKARAMIGLLCFALAVLVSPFKSKWRLEAETRLCLPHIKSGHIDDAVRPGSDGRECVQLARRRVTSARPVQ